MKKKEWNEGLNNLAPDIVENYIEQKEKFAKMNNSRDNLIHIVATVACLFFVVSSIVVGILVDDKIPTWENAQYSAEDIARMFNTANLEYDGVTNTYTNVYVPDSKYLYIDEIPKDEYLGIYQYNNVEKELNKNEFKSFHHLHFSTKIECMLDYFCYCMVTINHESVDEISHFLISWL